MNENHAIVPTHPSYGLLGFTRRSSGRGTPLFGSSIKHCNTMALTLSEAELNRDLHYDRFHAKKRLFEIEMSPTQFADLITSANCGMGVPVTIRWTCSDGPTEDPPTEAKRAQFENEFAAKVASITARIRQMAKDSEEKLKATGPLSKKEREEIAANLYHLEMEVTRNLPFIATMWNEQMDKTVTEAKGETEAFFSNIVAQLGVEHLADHLKATLEDRPKT